MSDPLPIRPPRPIDVAALFPELHRRLIDLLAGLDEEEWNRPTICTGWTVKDVALHMLGVDLGNLSTLRDEFADPWWAAASGDTIADLNAWNQDWVGAARRISPRLLCELLTLTGDAASRYFASLDLTATGGTVSWAGPEPAPVWLDVAREYTERWVHQQQIRAAVGRPGLTESRYLGPVLQAFVHALPRALHPVPAPEGTVARLVVSGEAGGRWVAVRDRDRWLLGQDMGQAAAATVTLDQDVAWRLWTRGITIDEAVPLVQCEGDSALTARILEMVSIIA
jgi:uncharacterized protein (TIGR03083 family)